MGTRFFPALDGAVLVLEDVNEPPYRVDRMLNQLAMAGVFDRVAGVVFGEFVDCEPERETEGRIEDVIDDFVARVSCPVFCGLPYGHGKARRVLPIGLGVEDCTGCVGVWFMKKIPLIFFVALSLSCAVINKLNLLTPEQEVELGRQASREVERSVRLYRDPVVRAYIDSLGQALVRVSARSQFRYYFKVVDAPEVNAFALPGGFIYVNLGLIKAADDRVGVGWRDRARNWACGDASRG